jgi:hypothetical protein
MTNKRVLGIAGMLAAVLALGAVGFAVGRQLGGDDGSPPAAAAGTPAAPAAAATPAPGTATATPQAPAGVDPYTGLPLDPDTSKPLWAAPYQDADRELPRFDGVLAGVRIGPDADHGVDQLPRCSKTRWGTLKDIASTPLDLPLSLPVPGFKGGHLGWVIVCEDDGRPLEVTVDYAFDPDPAGVFRGGGLTVTKSRLEPRNGSPAASLWVPAPRMREMEVAGGPAAVAVPILPVHGVGEAALVTYRDGILTVIRGEVPLPTLLAVADHILRGGR